MKDLVTNTRIGRNDACPCGSGRKYKKCCLLVDEQNEVSSVVSFAAKKLYQLEHSVVFSHLLPYFSDAFSDDLREPAFADYMPTVLPEDVDEELFTDYFMPLWLTSHWQTYCEISELPLTPLESYLSKFSGDLNSIKKRFISILEQSHYSFYMVLNVVPGRTMTVKDLLLGTSHVVSEQYASRDTIRGDLIFSRIVNLDGTSIFCGMAPMFIPVIYHGCQLAP